MMTPTHESRRVLLCVLAALVFAAETNAQATAGSTLVEVSTTRLPTVPSPGFRLGTSLSGAWDTNPLNVPGGVSDYLYGIGFDGSYGSSGRRSTAGATGSAHYRGYRELHEARTLAGAASVAVSHRASRRLTAAAEGGVRYDNCANLQFLNENAIQLPQTKTLAVRGEAGLRFEIDRRTQWSSSVSYDRIAFETGPLIDTSAFRADSAFARRFAGIGDISVGYQFASMSVLASTGAAQNARTPSHSGAIGWGRRLPLDLSVGILAGTTFVPAPSPDGSGEWLFLGGANISRKGERSTVGLSYRRSTSPGYGLGQLLYSNIFNASLAVPLSTRFAIAALGTVDRSRNVLNPLARFDSDYADLQLVTRLTRDTSVTLFYQYRRYRYSDARRTQSQTAGLILGNVLQTGRRPREGDRSR